MDGLIDQIQDQHDQVRREASDRRRDAACRQAVTAACDVVARWRPDHVIEPGWRPVEENDVMVQLAWAVGEVAGAIRRCGFTDQLEQAAGEKGEPARAYGLGLVMLAGEDGQQEELERRLHDAWRRPTVWREVAAWIQQLPRMLWPPAVASPPGPADHLPDRRRGTRRIRTVVPANEAEPGNHAAGTGTGLSAEPQHSEQYQVEVVPLKQAAKMLGVSLRKAYKMFRVGELQGPAGKPYRAYLRSINELLATPSPASNSRPAEPDPLPQPDTRQRGSTPERRRQSRGERPPQGFQFFELP